MTAKFTLLEVEAAMNLWEHVVDCRANGFFPKPVQELEDAGLGTVEIRHAVMAMAPECSRIAELLCKKHMEINGAYDWDYCPAFLDKAVVAHPDKRCLVVRNDAEETMLGWNGRR